jgi:hypothetical protein
VGRQAPLGRIVSGQRLRWLKGRRKRWRWRSVAHRKGGEASKKKKKSTDEIERAPREEDDSNIPEEEARHGEWDGAQSIGGGGCAGLDRRKKAELLRLQELVLWRRKLR